MRQEPGYIKMGKKDPLTAPYPILGADGRLLWQGEYVKK
jgi:hypothetical protein